MPRKLNILTKPRPPGMVKFVRLIAEGNDIPTALDAMPGKPNPETYLDHPDIGWLIADALLRRVAGLAAPKAVTRLIELLDSRDERVALAAVKLALERVVPQVSAADVSAPPSDDLASLTTEQLARKIDTLEAELSDRATDVSPKKPNGSALKDPQVLDMFR